jgi:hypothetical protein
MMKRYQTAVVFLFAVAIWGIPPRVGAQVSPQRPIAIDGTSKDEQFVLGDRGTVFRVRHQLNGIDVVPFANLPAGEAPVDLTLVNVSRAPVLGVNGAVLVLTTRHLPEGAVCHVNAFDLSNAAPLGVSSIAGACGGIDVFPGAGGIYAYVTTAGESKISKVELLPTGFGSTITLTTLPTVIRPGAIAVVPGGMGWFVADAAGAGITEINAAHNGFRISRVSGVNTSVSSLRMVNNGILYATDTSMQRVFRLVRLHGTLTPDIVPQKIPLVHPTGITTAGKGFVVIDDATGLVNILNSDWSLLLSTKPLSGTAAVASDVAAAVPELGVEGLRITSDKGSDSFA